MGELNVSDVTVPTLLDKLQKNEWVVPQFQREFVWSIAAIISLVHSILEARPIGMATLWEQPEKGEIELESISIPDWDNIAKRTKSKYFSDVALPAKKYAILDGKQRCTAIAMAFGAFKSDHGNYRFTGRFFINVAEKDPVKRIVFCKESEIKKSGLTTDSSCVSKGYYPISSSKPGEGILQQWMRYLQMLTDPNNYADGKLPISDELNRRNEVLKNAFEGIAKTKLAVYAVPSEYQLADICEIFETLNTTGTKVSTVDLIHSWLFKDTYKESQVILLRDWLDDLNEKDGATGWATKDDRPELIAQIVTSIYIALEVTPAPPRRGGGDITSVKSNDLLATPTEHWKIVCQSTNTELLAQYMGLFQKVVANGYFPWTACPYPVTIAIYVSLRWHHKHDSPNTHQWSIDELDALFRAFFWRNALNGRYDQGFLTQIGTDIKTIKQWLNERINHTSTSSWIANIQPSFDKYINPIPESDIKDQIREGKQTGALWKALLLPILTGVKSDFINSKPLTFPENKNQEVHHIFPKAWCKTNRVGHLAELLDPEKSGYDWVESVANLIPLSRESNNNWKAKIPGQYINENSIAYPPLKSTFDAGFIDEDCFSYLTEGAGKIRNFWERRTDLIANDFGKKCQIIL